MGNLDKYQEESVRCSSKDTLIVAPPGSGKTTVILNRVKYLIEEQGVRSGNIVVITFTKAAAQNMKNRFMKLCPNLQPPFFGTFHGLFYKLLLRHENNINIIDSGEAYGLIRKELTHFSDDVSDDKIREVLNNISLKKTSINISDFKPTLPNDLFDRCFESYEDHKREKGLVDFDDLQIRLRKLLMDDEQVLNYYRNMFKYVLVDEFQDCDSIQIEFLKLINTNLFCVGDEDQCIYSFRGSTPECMVDFQREFKGGEKIYLKYNYRSVQNVVELSKDIIKNNKERHNKTIESHRKALGELSVKIPYDETKQVNHIIDEVKKSRGLGDNYGDTAILYRTNMESRSLVDGFIRNKIPFKLLDREYNFFNHFICQDLIAYLKLAIDPYSKQCFSRIINKPFRYVAKTAIQKVMAHKEKADVFDILTSLDDMHPFQMKKLEALQRDIATLNKYSLMSSIEYILTDLEYSHYIREYSEKYKQNQQELLDIVEEFKNAAMDFNSIITFLVHIEEVQENLKEISRKGSAIDGVIFSTIHGVKGMEFKNVHIIDVVDEYIPHVNGVENLEEERRLFYVGTTRAINNLYIYSPKTVKGRFRVPSSFIPTELFNKENEKYEASVKEGQIIKHTYFGRGIIAKVEQGNVDILFNDDVTRKFAIRTLMENNLIEIM